MADAAVPVTQSAVERFTEQYLRFLGCSIEKRGDRWDVTAPDGVGTELSSREITLVCGTDHDGEDGEELLHPGSGFFQQILSEAGEWCPTGKLSLETEDTEVEIPEWIEESSVEVENARFTPYYDRTAIVILFQVSIETVSEYQREFLRAIAVDVRSNDGLPKLEETFLRLTSLDRGVSTSNQTDLEKGDVRPVLDTAREQLVDRIQDQVDEIHQEASRATDAELEEYRQMQQQRIQELEEERSTLSSKMDKLRNSIDSGQQEDRIQALKERKELKSEYDEIDTELDELRERRERGFPERQREIRERHTLDVVISPLTATQVKYERGEIELELVENQTVQTVTVGYGSGVGITEEVQCSSCNRGFSEQNPLRTIRGGLQCKECTI